MRRFGLSFTLNGHGHIGVDWRFRARHRVCVDGGTFQIRLLTGLAFILLLFEIILYIWWIVFTAQSRRLRAHLPIVALWLPNMRERASLTGTCRKPSRRAGRGVKDLLTSSSRWRVGIGGARWPLVVLTVRTILACLYISFD